MEKRPPEANAPHEQLLRTSVFGVALVAGVGSAVVKVWDMFYDNMKERGPIAELRTARKNEMNDVLVKAQTTPLSRSGFVEKTAAIERRFGTKFNSFVKDTLGIESEGLGMIKGTAQRFSALGPYTQRKIVFGTVFSTAVTVGGYMLLNQNADMKQALRRNHEALAKQTAAQDTGRA
ncbi:MAG: hypothetical protein V4735_03195 [Pseudomonadota bacterium]